MLVSEIPTLISKYPSSYPTPTPAPAPTPAPTPTPTSYYLVLSPSAFCMLSLDSLLNHSTTLNLIIIHSFIIYSSVFFILH